MSRTSDDTDPITKGSSTSLALSAQRTALAPLVKQLALQTRCLIDRGHIASEMELGKGDSCCGAREGSRVPTGGIATRARTRDLPMAGECPKFCTDRAVDTKGEGMRTKFMGLTILAAVIAISVPAFAHVYGAGNPNPTNCPNGNVCVYVYDNYGVGALGGVYASGNGEVDD